MATKRDYAAELRDRYNTVDQSDSGFVRDDATKERLKDLGSHLKQAESSGAGRGVQGGPTAGELKAKDTDDIRDAMEKARAEKKGVSVQQMRKGMSDEYDRKMKEGEFYKKGGSVKGWGMARGARKAKVY